MNNTKKNEKRKLERINKRKKESQSVRRVWVYVWIVSFMRSWHLIVGGTQSKYENIFGCWEFHFFLSLLFFVDVGWWCTNLHENMKRKALCQQLKHIEGGAFINQSNMIDYKAHKFSGCLIQLLIYYYSILFGCSVFIVLLLGSLRLSDIVFFFSSLSWKWSISRVYCEFVEK